MLGTFNRMADELLAKAKASVLARQVVANFASLVEGVSAVPVWRERSVANQGIPEGFYKVRFSVLLMEEP